MQKFVFNMDDGWNFSRLARRHLLHWHPSVKPDCFLVSKYFEKFEKEPEVLPWPRVVDDDVFSGIIANYEAAEELKDLKIVAIITTVKNLNEAENLIQKFSKNRSTRFCLFLRLSEDTSIEESLLQRLVTPSNNKVFDLVFIIDGNSEKRLQTIAITLDLLVSDQLFYDDYFRDAEASERVLQVQIGPGNGIADANKYEDAYLSMRQVLIHWVRTETKISITNEDDLLTEICAFHNEEIKDGFKSDDKLSAHVPHPGLSPANFFFRFDYFQEIKSQRDRFDQQLDVYLEVWFRIFNKQNRIVRKKFKQNQDLRIEAFKILLNPLMQIDIAALEDAITTVNEAIEDRRKEITDLLIEIQADITPESRQAVQSSNQESRGFKRKYFRIEEKAVDDAYHAIEFPWNLQARKKIFWGAFVVVMLLSATPLVTLRMNQVGIPYWQNYNAWLLDISWFALWLIPTLTGLFYSTRKRQKIVQKAVEQLASKLNLLFSRHKKACIAAETYSIVRLYLQELGFIKKYLQNAKLQKLSTMEKIEQINELTRNCVENYNISEQAPKNIDEWVAQAIKLSFTSQLQHIYIKNDLAPNQKAVESSSYFPTDIRVSVFRNFQGQ